jgi:hypothetical protein
LDPGFWIMVCSYALGDEDEDDVEIEIDAKEV